MIIGCLHKALALGKAPARLCVAATADSSLPAADLRRWWGQQRGRDGLVCAQLVSLTLLWGLASIETWPGARTCGTLDALSPPLREGEKNYSRPQPCCEALDVSRILICFRAQVSLCSSWRWDAKMQGKAKRMQGGQLSHRPKQFTSRVSLSLYSIIEYS